MSEATGAETLSGGCQCGAVRYRLMKRPARASICHCRMCQKAFGAYFAPFASMPVADMEWTRGAPKRFHSSDFVARGFCAECGTSLTYEYALDGQDRVAIALGSLDDPAAIRPEIQFGIEHRMPWLAELAALPGMTTAEDLGPELAAKIRSYQHPDHDTAQWPPQEGQNA